MSDLFVVEEYRLLKADDSSECVADEKLDADSSPCVSAAQVMCFCRLKPLLRGVNHVAVEDS